MTRRRVEVCVLLAATLLLSGGCSLRLQNITGIGGVDTATYRVSAVFAELTRLPVGATVRIGPKQVGEVAAVETRDFRAIVHMAIANGVRLPVGTRAELKLTSALGEQEIVLSRPDDAAEFLGDGGIIGPEHTAAGPDVEQTLAAVGALVTGAGLAQIRTIIDEVTTALHGRAGTIHDLLARLDSVLGELAGNNTAITKLIDSLRRLSETLARNTDTLRQALTGIQPAIEVLLSERERFRELLRRVDALARTANGLLNRTGEALTRAMRKLRPLLRDLRGIDERLGSLLAELDRFAGLMHQAVPGDYLLLDGTLDVPRTVAALLDPDLSGYDFETGGLRALLGGGTG